MKVTYTCEECNKKYVYKFEDVEDFPRDGSTTCPKGHYVELP